MLLWPQDVLLNLAMRSSKSSSLLECKRYFRNIASPQTFLAHLWETQYDTAPSWPIPIWPLISFLVFLNIQLSTRCLPWMSSQLKFNSKIQFITTTHSRYSYYLEMWSLDKRDKTNLLSLSFPFQKWYMNFSFFLFFFYSSMGSWPHFIYGHHPVSPKSCVSLSYLWTIPHGSPFF